jgi:hypothetical protein
VKRIVGLLVLVMTFSLGACSTTQKTHPLSRPELTGALTTIYKEGMSPDQLAVEAAAAGFPVSENEAREFIVNKEKAAAESRTKAVTLTEDDVDVYQNSDGKTLTIRKYKGSSPNVIIPQKLYGLPVTGISGGAFSGKGLTGIVIPEGITAIGSVERVERSEEGMRIITWSGTFDNNQLTSVTIPNSVTYIGYNAFAGNRLTSVIIPNSVIQIGGGAFSNNPLTSLTIPNTLAAVDVSAFSGDLRRVIIVNVRPGSVPDVFRIDAAFGTFCKSQNYAPGTYVKNGPIWSIEAADQEENLVVTPGGK